MESNSSNNTLLPLSPQINGAQQQQQLQSPSGASIAGASVVSVSVAAASSSNIIEPQLSIAATTTTAPTAATMPAMAKEKASAAVSLGESNYLTELAVVVGMATTAAAAQRLQQAPPAVHVCGCGSASAAAENNNNSRYGSGNKCLTNGEFPRSAKFSRPPVLTNTLPLLSGHTSPLAAAVASNSSSVATTPQCSKLCCRQQYQILEHVQFSCNMQLQTHQLQQQQQQQPHQHQQQQQQNPAARRSPNDFIFGRYIGEGSFSMVYLAVDIHSRREYASKSATRLTFA